MSLPMDGIRAVLRPTLILSGSTVARPRKPAIELPPYVNCVRVKGRPYYYLHVGRGTDRAAKPIRLPNDPRDPEFWATYRRLMGEPEPKANPKSFNHLIEAYKQSPEYTELAAASRRDYNRYLNTIRETWGELEVVGLLPAHVLALRDKGRNSTRRHQRADPRVVRAHIMVSSARLSRRQPVSARAQALDRLGLVTMAMGDDRTRAQARPGLDVAGNGVGALHRPTAGRRNRYDMGCG